MKSVCFRFWPICAIGSKSGIMVFAGLGDPHVLMALPAHSCFSTVKALCYTWKKIVFTSAQWEATEMCRWERRLFEVGNAAFPTAQQHKAHPHQRAYISPGQKTANRRCSHKSETDIIGYIFSLCLILNGYLQM